MSHYNIIYLLGFLGDLFRSVGNAGCFGCMAASAVRRIEMMIAPVSKPLSGVVDFTTVLCVFGDQKWVQWSRE